MPKYLISWEEACWYDLEIEAGSKKEALEMFHNTNYDREDVKWVGQEILPDSIDIERL